ncbi:M20/M25/M40 family metallo-hydrolase [Bordetella pseudohinzii]|uniref:Carboxypeptidase G2 n=2 Tax=Bordetella pseudohinzii TaxID=1331258 RepID=A0A0J6BTV9_9BORD|nr:M20/M25/M40 family metallo-hydrolase [Bordetella pseudohinzii]ANY16246.1 glutamate carboxypeptidase [Bordetella pseudohinzii]KMM25254.1 glutamate carboxypeptidase [Bordetella pseudohinzii]KXA76124.1 glutamate carboxypeptidase [Bordetella pseudohinzii]KXA77975.1 glutamate carboxypeptidase [Bordetella pseudohinzii]CUJ15028.1 Carboxypeptidase G2 precursor [Bordetella pseudohinzii]
MAKAVKAGWRLVLAAALLAGGSAMAEPLQPVLDAAKAQEAGLLDTLRDLVNIESGSRDVHGVKRIAERVAEGLRAQGGQVQVLPPDEVFRMDDTPKETGPMVQAVFKGRGQKKIMLIAHMDTVYRDGMLKDQPFRIDGKRAYGLGIADDKQGVALIIHALALLRALDYQDYGTLTVLVNGDEEISSPGARATITRLAADQDAVFSFEGGGSAGDLRLATSGIGAAYLTVQGKTSHAGARPEGGVNALYELAHQVLQMKDLSKPEQGLKLNWTLAQAGSNRNVIPGQATAQADARALRVADFDALQQAMEEKIRNKLLPESKVELKFEVRRPPLEATEASRALARHGVAIYQELGLPMKVLDRATGGGTDAAFAQLKARGPVIEGFGLSGFGAHSNDAEYVDTQTIVPRLYLTARMIMDISAGKAP